MLALAAFSLFQLMFGRDVTGNGDPDAGAQEMETRNPRPWVLVVMPGDRDTARHTCTVPRAA